MTVDILCLGIGIVALIPVVLSRLLPLANTRFGWLFYLANLVGEFVVKRLGLNRFAFELTAGAAGTALITLGSGLTTGLGVGLALAVLELAVRREERRLLVTAWTRQDSIGPAPADTGTTQGLATGYPTPSVHPELTVNLVGPFVSRKPRYCLGTLVVGRCVEVDVLIANHTVVPTQTCVRLVAGGAEGVAIEGPSERLLPAAAAGSCHRHRLSWTVHSEGGAARLPITVIWGDTRQHIVISVDRRITADRARITGAEVQRYPGGCRSAFALRGDMDLYDASTLQSVEGLEVTFGLAARYRMPQTMYLSTRLSLDEAEARRWADHYGIDRGAGRIPVFVEWMRDRVDLVHRRGYPYGSTKPYLIELGNHGHLHFGTDTAGAAENGWKHRSRIGAGRYPWLGKETGSFAEQRDNALEARRWCEELFGYTPRSWAMPDRTRDEHTPAAMAAAGCEVLSDSDVRTVDNVLFQPPPHFPAGCTAVELTKRYPGDPQHVFHVGMNTFWIHRAHRLGIPVVFMCHQHMLQFEGSACTRLTEAVLRHVLTSFHGDLWINTVYGIGTYWRDVLSPRSRAVEVSAAGAGVRVGYSGNLDHEAVPIDLRFAGGGRATYLVDLEPGTDREISLT